MKISNSTLIYLFNYSHQSHTNYRQPYLQHSEYPSEAVDSLLSDFKGFLDKLYQTTFKTSQRAKYGVITLCGRFSNTIFDETSTEPKNKKVWFHHHTKFHNVIRPFPTIYFNFKMTHQSSETNKTNPHHYLKFSKISFQKFHDQNAKRISTHYIAPHF